MLLNHLVCGNDRLSVWFGCLLFFTSLFYCSTVIKSLHHRLNYCQFVMSSMKTSPYSLWIIIEVECYLLLNSLFINPLLLGHMRQLDLVKTQKSKNKGFGMTSTFKLRRVTYCEWMVRLDHGSRWLSVEGFGLVVQTWLNEGHNVGSCAAYLGGQSVGQSCETHKHCHLPLTLVVIPKTKTYQSNVEETERRMIDMMAG